MQHGRGGGALDRLSELVPGHRRHKEASCGPPWRKCAVVKLRLGIGPHRYDQVQVRSGLERGRQRVQEGDAVALSGAMGQELLELIDDDQPVVIRPRTRELVHRR